jgi:hypothetical protein
MRYMGGKERIARYIAPIINDSLGGGGVFVSPFAGGLSVESRVVADRYLLSDAHGSLCCMWDAVLSRGWVPPVWSRQRTLGLRGKSGCRVSTELLVQVNP